MEKQKPEYLELLNAISLGESDAGVYLEAWANATHNEDLAGTLRLVAARESSHGMAFKRLIEELGFEVEPKYDAAASARLAKYANPKICDVDKLGPEKPDPRIEQFFADTEKKIADGHFDAVTANMMRWYICEERDSGEKLRACAAAVRKAANGSAMPNGNGAATADHAPGADAQAIMACMTAGFKALEATLERLGQRAA